MSYSMHIVNSAGIPATWSKSHIGKMFRAATDRQIAIRVIPSRSSNRNKVIHLRKKQRKSHSFFVVKRILPTNPRWRILPQPSSKFHVWRAGRCKCFFLFATHRKAVSPALVEGWWPSTRGIFYDDQHAAQPLIGGPVCLWVFFFLAPLRSLRWVVLLFKKKDITMNAGYHHPTCKASTK